VVISYLAGGPAVAVPLALMIAVTIRSLRQPTLPRWTGCLGVSAVVFSVLSAGILLGPMNNSSAWYGVLLLAAVLGFVWTFVTSIALASSSDPALTTKA
jgi:multisubunit Na+/H+ antiporter MnhF subunit